MAHELTFPEKYETVDCLMVESHMRSLRTRIASQLYDYGYSPYRCHLSNPLSPLSAFCFAPSLAFDVPSKRWYLVETGVTSLKNVRVKH